MKTERPRATSSRSVRQSRKQIYTQFSKAGGSERMKIEILLLSSGQAIGEGCSDTFPSSSNTFAGREEFFANLLLTGQSAAVPEITHEEFPELASLLDEIQEEDIEDF